MTNLKWMRERRNISQQELASKMGYSQTSICAMERKGIYDIRTAGKYAKILDCPAFFLLEGIGI